MTRDGGPAMLLQKAAQSQWPNAQQPWLPSPGCDGAGVEAADAAWFDDMSLQCGDMAWPVVVLAMFPICPPIPNGCAIASIANAVHASNARISRLRKMRERGWSERRMLAQHRPVTHDPQLDLVPGKTGIPAGAEFTQANRKNGTADS
jgi:hypothetical protein